MMVRIPEVEAIEIFASLDAEYKTYKAAAETAETSEDEEAAWAQWCRVQDQAIAARGYDPRDVEFGIDL